jgi:DNA-binding MarR family transcriptional regulator
LVQLSGRNMSGAYDTPLLTMYFIVKYIHYMAGSTRNEEALDRLLEVVTFLGNDMTSALARDGLTDARAHVLWELQRTGPTTQRALADAMHVSPRNITGLIDGLVATGFVSRQPHPTDRRAIMVTFTEHGASTAAELVQGHRQLADQLFAAMPDNQLVCLLGGLGEVLERLAAASAAAHGATAGHGRHDRP